jgi:hypothetical protein
MPLTRKCHYLSACGCSEGSPVRARSYSAWTRSRGTTLVAAHRLARQWIGVDISPTAVNLAKWRMQKVGASDVKRV